MNLPKNMLRIALFAADEVGLAVAECFHENAVRPACLVLDEADPKQINGQIRVAANAEAVLLCDAAWSEAAIQRLTAASPDLGILAWWPYLIKPTLMGIPKRGCLNFHPSLLPYNRGKHPNFWSLVEESPFGASIHWIDAGIDSGAVAFQKPIKKNWEDTGKTLHEKARREMVALFREHFHSIVQGHIPCQPQNLAKGSFHLGKELKPASQIILDQAYPARYLLNLLRARTFPPHPAAWFEEDGKRFEVNIQIKEITNE